jgi:hypothetical protein
MNKLTKLSLSGKLYLGLDSQGCWPPSWRDCICWRSRTDQTEQKFVCGKPYLGLDSRGCWPPSWRGCWWRSRRDSRGWRAQAHSWTTATRTLSLYSTNRIFFYRSSIWIFILCHIRMKKHILFSVGDVILPLLRIRTLSWSHEYTVYWCWLVYLNQIKQFMKKTQRHIFFSFLRGGGGAANCSAQAGRCTDSKAVGNYPAI